MSIYTEVVLKKVNGKFIITDRADSFESRVDYEAMAAEDGIEMVRLDGRLPKWAKSASEGFFENLDIGSDNLYYAYAQKKDAGVVLIGLVRN